MHCFCDDEQEEIKYLKIEGDFGADAIWCDDCGNNLEIEDVTISNSLKEKLHKWALSFGEWIDLEHDRLFENGLQMETTHNELGEALTEEVQRELGASYNVSFSPSTSARLYGS